MRRFLPVTIVTGPFIWVNGLFTKSFNKLFIRVLLPTLGGPTTAIMIGGGSRGVLSTTGICCFLVSISCFLRNRLSALIAELKANAFGFLCLSVSSTTGFSASFLDFFLSALRP